jgi:hypothetical protein
VTSEAEELLHISAAAHNVQDQDILLLDAIKNDVLPYRKATHAGSQIMVATASDMRREGNQVEVVSEG